MEFIKGLKGSDLIIYNILLSCQGRWQISGGNIVQLTSYNRSTVYRALRRLEHAGLVKRHGKSGQTYIYTIVR